MESMTLYIAPDDRDLEFDNAGNFKVIYDDDVTVQNVRHTLLTWKAEFFADREHGTDYEQIMGLNENDIDYGLVEEVIREAIFQEPKVERIDSLDVTLTGRTIDVVFTATLISGETVTLEVKA